METENFITEVTPCRVTPGDTWIDVYERVMGGKGRKVAELSVYRDGELQGKWFWVAFNYEGKSVASGVDNVFDACDKAHKAAYGRDQ